MTKTLEVLDALPGCGKTTAIFKYMAQNQHKPWLYLSPLAKEINERVQKESIENSMDFFIPNALDGKLSDQVLPALQSGRNVACTHALMMRFTDEHIKAIKSNGYGVVCDEELNLIGGYNMLKSDFEFLVSHNLISIDPEDGKVEFLDKNMGDDARYADVKKLADMECLYAAKRDNRMLVTQLSTKLIRASEQFILLTYNYDRSIMETFMKLHGYEFKEFTVPLYRTSEDVRKNLRDLIEIVELPIVKKIQDKYTLSKSWWVNTATIKERQEVANAIRSVARSTETVPSDLFYTLPKDVVELGSFNTGKIGKDNFISCNVKATNDYKHKKLAVHAYALFPNQAVKAYMQDMGQSCNDDVYALNMLLQWLFRGCIREEQHMKVALLSKKMSLLFKLWLWDQK